MLLALEAEFNLKSEDLSIGMEEETVVATG